MKSRTIRDFKISKNIWPIVEAWAKESNFHLKEQTRSTRLYEKHSFPTSSMMLKITQTAGQVHLEVWIPSSLFVRFLALFLVPAEMGIESGGFLLVFPRSIARESVNKLLDQFGKPKIR